MYLSAKYGIRGQIIQADSLLENRQPKVPFQTAGFETLLIPYSSLKWLFVRLRLIILHARVPKYIHVRIKVGQCLIQNAYFIV